MGETNSPSVAHVGYNISPFSRVKLKILIWTLLSGEISYPTGNWRRIYIYIEKNMSKSFLCQFDNNLIFLVIQHLILYLFLLILTY
jgi:hypothetical protein